MATIGELREALLPDAIPFGEPAVERLGTAVAWVRVLRARVPAFDALDPGDLVIAAPSALAVVAPGSLELRDFVAALAAVPVSGLLVPEGEIGGAPWSRNSRWLHRRPTP